MTTSQPWLASYEPGVPATINLGEYNSLVDLLDQAFKQHAKRDMAAFMDVHWTFEQVDELSRSLAAYFQSLGLAKGARIALMMPNVPQYVVAIAAVLRAGYVVVNVNPLYTPRELEHQLKDSGAEAIVILENFATTLQEVIARTPVKTVVLAAMGDLLPFVKGALVNFVVRHVKKMVPAFSLPTGSVKVVSFKDALAKGASAKYYRPNMQPSDVAFLQYTGGTTGVSKGATLLHSNVVANILQNEAWFKPELSKLGNQPLVAVCALPLYHIFALTVCYFMGARMGSMNILIPNPRDLPAVIKTLGKYKINQFPAVNTLFNALANDPDFIKLDFSGLKVSMGGGMAVQQATAEKWKKVTGCAIVEGYGLSETSPVATANRLDNTEFNGSIGYPLPSTEVAILDDDGNHLEIGAVGEIAIRGPQVMAGYWQRADETAKVVTLPPGVLECAAVGVADEKSGEAVKLFVVRKDSTLTEAQLKAYCHEQLTGYKCPKYVEFRNDLPKTNVGKILRRELRDEKKAA